MKKLAIVAALSAIGTSALAAPETYAVDAAHTAPRFEYNHLGISYQTHRFDKTSGQIVLDRAAKAASVDITIDAKSVNTGFSLFNEHIQAEDYFHTAQYPTITFKSTAVKFDGDKPVAVDGNLTIKGVTKPVTLTVTYFMAKQNPIYKKDAIGANASAKIKRSEFNMAKNVPGVSDEVTLSISVEALKQ